MDGPDLDPVSDATEFDKVVDRQGVRKARDRCGLVTVEADGTIPDRVLDGLPCGREIDRRRPPDDRRLPIGGQLGPPPHEEGWWRP